MILPNIVRLTDSSQFSLSDYERLAALLPRFTLRGPQLEAYIEKLITHGELHALVDGTALKGLIGFYANDTVTHCAYLSLIVVDRSLQGVGCGTSLMEILLVSCRRARMSSISLNVVRDNASAIAFYNRLGFSIVGPGRDADHFLMAKELPATIDA